MIQKRKKFETKSAFKTRVKKRAKKEETIFFGIIITAVIYYIFFDSLSFGGDYRYDLFVFWLPTMLGFFVAIKYSFVAEYWSSLLVEIIKENHFLLKIFYPLFLVIITFMYSIMMFWMPSNIIWDIFNKIEAQNNRIEIFQYPIEKFNGGKTESIGFYFNKSWETIPVHYEVVKPYLDKNPHNYKIKLEVRKGLWNHYVLESWDIEEVKNH